MSAAVSASSSQWGLWLKGCKKAATVAVVVASSWLALLPFAPPVQAKSSPGFQVTDVITQGQLPAQGRDVLALVYAGGPFRYDKDGTVFGNREKLLPSQNRGYYREYTVKTPSERSRGARRIVCGGVKPTAPDACYYTDDHYASFRKIVQ